MKLLPDQTKFSDGNTDVPGLFWGQFASDEAPFNSLAAISAWTAGKGFGAAQIPSWDKRLFDLVLASESKAYCDDVRGVMAEHRLVPAHLATHLQGQLMAQSPAHYGLLDFCGPAEVAGNPHDQYLWAQGALIRAIDASVMLGLKTVFTFPGSFCFPYVYPWPPRPETLLKAAFRELARRWLPVLDHAEANGQKIGFEIHPMEDMFDGPSWERFLSAVGNHPAAGIAYDPSHLILQGIDPIKFLDTYHDRVVGTHWKDAELNCDGRQGVYSGLLPFLARAGRFRSLGDGQLNILAMEAAFVRNGLSLHRVLEWEDVVKPKELGAEEGAKIIQAAIDDQLIPLFPVPEVPTAQSFEKFAASGGSRLVFETCLGFPIPDADAQELGLV